MSSKLHEAYLDELVYNLDAVGESRGDVLTIIKGPIWFSRQSSRQKSLCDMILIYEDYGVPMELKGSKYKRRKALRQINKGKEWLNEFFPDLDVPYGKFITYGKTTYGYELVPFEVDEARRILGDNYRPPFLI